MENCTGLCGINAIIDSIDQEQPNLNPTQIYNEGWMTRLLVKFSIEDKLKFKRIDFSSIHHWCSEALIRSPFLPRKRKDPLAESHTHADMAIGDFEVNFGYNSEIKLKNNPNLFGIVEAKMGSNLSRGITHAENYNQASRSLACIAYMTKDTSCKIFFSVVAPEYTLEKYKIDEQIDKEFMMRQIRGRFNQYDEKFRKDEDMDGVLAKANECDVWSASYEDWIDAINDPQLKRALKVFYGKAKKWNNYQVRKQDK